MWELCLALWELFTKSTRKLKNSSTCSSTRQFRSEDDFGFLVLVRTLSVELCMRKLNTWEWHIVWIMKFMKQELLDGDEICSKWGWIEFSEKILWIQMFKIISLLLRFGIFEFSSTLSAHWKWMHWWDREFLSLSQCVTVTQNEVKNVKLSPRKMCATIILVKLKVTMIILPWKCRHVEWNEVTVKMLEKWEFSCCRGSYSFSEWKTFTFIRRLSLAVW